MIKLTFKRHHAGIYQCRENDNIVIKSMGQHTGEFDQDSQGNAWVFDVLGMDDEAYRFKTKREAVEHAEIWYNNQL